MFLNRLLVTAVLVAMPAFASTMEEPVLLVHAEEATGSILAYANWPIRQGWFIQAAHVCREKLLFEFWPLSPVCEGRLYREPNDHGVAELQLAAAKYRLSTRTRAIDPGLRVADETGTAQALYARLLAQESPVVRFDGKSYELEGFQEHHAAAAAAGLKRAQAVAWVKRGQVMGVAIGCLALLAVAIYLLRRARVAASKVGAGVKQAVVSTLVEAEKRKVRGIVIDEAIRQTTRTAMAAASEDEKAALRNQIKQALDSGDHRLAMSLTSVLQKLDRA